MKFILFVEGHTEQKVLPAFFKRWLDPRLCQQVGVQPVRFDGWPHFVKKCPGKAKLHLDSSVSPGVIAVIGLLDLYGPQFYPPHLASAQERLQWAVADLERKVGDPRFRMFFAVHEIEAWLLSNPEVFPPPIRDALVRNCGDPETVDFEEPPGKLLARLYIERTGRTYKKVVHGQELFTKLDPEVAYRKCPQLKNMLDSMLQMARGDTP